MSFVNIEITKTTQTLVEEGVQRLVELMEAKGYIGWKAKSADITTILIETLGPLASDVAEVAAALPEAAFRTFGTKLEGVPYNEGAKATVRSLWTLLPEGETYPARTITAGTQLAIGAFGFLVESDVEVKAGESTAHVQLVAIEQGTEYNRLSGTAELVNSIDWVKEVSLEGETIGGAESESDEEYMNRLVARQQVRAEVPIVASDFATFARNTPSDVLPSGVVVGRSTSIDGYNPTLETYENERTVCTVVTDSEGKSLSAEAMTAIEGWLKEHREINFNAYVRAPSYNAIYATVKVHALTGYDSAAIETTVQAAIKEYLSPKYWANPNRQEIGSNGWLNKEQGYNVVRYNSLVGVIEAVRGVSYVFAGSEGLKVGTTAEPTGTGDITMTGPAPLPEAKTITVTTG